MDIRRLAERSRAPGQSLGRSVQTGACRYARQLLRIGWEFLTGGPGSRAFITNAVGPGIELIDLFRAPTIAGLADKLVRPVLPGDESANSDVLVVLRDGPGTPVVFVGWIPDSANDSGGGSGLPQSGVSLCLEFTGRSSIIPPIAAELLRNMQR